MNLLLKRKKLVPGTGINRAGQGRHRAMRCEDRSGKWRTRTLARKTAGTAQVRGYPNSDLKPDAVIIVRPSRLGPRSTYAITRKRN